MSRIRETLALQIENIHNRFNALSASERRLIILTAIVACVCVCVLSLWKIHSGYRDNLSKAESREQFMQRLDELEAPYRRAIEDERMAQMALAQNQIVLFTHLSKAAEKAGVVLSDLDEKERPIDDGAIKEKTVTLTLKKLSVDQLHAFIEQIESVNMVKVTKFAVKTRYDDPEYIDIQAMTVSSWYDNT